MNAVCQCEPLSFNVAEGFLNVAEEALISWEDEIYGVDISKHIVQPSDTKFILGGWYACQDLQEANFPVCGELKCRIDCIHYPTQHHLTG